MEGGQKWVFLASKPLCCPVEDSVHRFPLTLCTAYRLDCSVCELRDGPLDAQVVHKCQSAVDASGRVAVDANGHGQRLHVYVRGGLLHHGPGNAPAPCRPPGQVAQ